MSRKNKNFSRIVTPDPKYGDVTITQAINIMMRGGKKGVAERAVYSALEVLAEKSGKPPVEAFHQALSNIRPAVEVRSRRVGGATYQVPTEVNSRRAQSLALRWLVKSANERSEKVFANRLAGELLDALDKRGLAVKKREDTHKMADANKAFAHFRW